MATPLERLAALPGELQRAPDAAALLGASVRSLAAFFPASTAIAAAFDVPADVWCVAATGADEAAAAAYAATLRRQLEGVRTRDGLPSLQLLWAPCPVAEQVIPLEPIDEGVHLPPALLAVIWPARRSARQPDAALLSAVAAIMALALQDQARTALLRIQRRQRHVFDEFLSLMSHDLRTPLTSIRGYAQLALRQARSPELAAIRSALQTVMHQADRLAAMTDVLLDVARIRTGRLTLYRTTCDLGEIVRLAAEERAGQADTPPIHVQVPASGIILRADARRVAQIASAFIAFATARTPPGSAVSLGVAQDGEYARLDVDDSGAIIPPDQSATLFHQLVELAEDGRGRALGHIGLHIAAGAIAAHGGRLSVQSPIPGAATGARLSAWLPISPPGAP